MSGCFVGASSSISDWNCSTSFNGSGIVDLLLNVLKQHLAGAPARLCGVLGSLAQDRRPAHRRVCAQTPKIGSAVLEDFRDAGMPPGAATGGGHLHLTQALGDRAQGAAAAMPS